MKKSKTIDDVAEAANYSRATVWRALNKPELVSTKTVDKINQVIRQIGYFPDVTARSLRTKQSGLIALVVPSVDNNFAPIVQSISEVAIKLEFEVIVGITNYDHQLEFDVVTRLLGRQISALILSGNDQSHKTRSILIDAKIPVVQIWETDGDPIFSMVGFSNIGLGQKVSQFFLESNRRQLFVVLNSEHTRARNRLAGFQKTVTANAQIDVALQIFDVSNSKDTLEKYINKVTYPDAIYLNGTEYLYRILKRIKSLGLSVPGDVMVVVFGEPSYKEFLGECIYFVKIPDLEIGQVAAKLVEDMITSPETESVVIDLGFEIVGT